jgi:hypothetical protein
MEPVPDFSENLVEPGIESGPLDLYASLQQAISKRISYVTVIESHLHRKAASLLSSKNDIRSLF